MLSATFHDWGGGADGPDFSVDLTWSTATIRTPDGQDPPSLPLSLTKAPSGS